MTPPLSDQRDEDGQRTWIEIAMSDPTDPSDLDFTNLWLQHVPRGKPILIGRRRTPTTTPG